MRDGEGAFERAQDVGDDVERGVGRVPVVHEDGGGARLGRDLGDGGIALEAPDVVDDRGAGGEGAPRHLRLPGVDGDRRGCAGLGKAGEDGLHPRPFLFGRYDDVAGAARFAADIDDIRPLQGHAQGRRHGRARLVMDAAVRERIGGDVDDAHDERASAEFERPGAVGQAAHGRGMAAHAGAVNDRTSTPIAEGPALGPGLPPRPHKAVTAGERSMRRIEKTTRLAPPAFQLDRKNRQTNWLRPGIEPTMGPITSSPAFSRP